MNEQSLLNTLQSTRILLRWQPLLTSFAICAIVLELETVLWLKIAQSSAFSTTSAGFVLAQCAVFTLFLWGSYSISHEINSHVSIDDDETSFFARLKTAPLSYILPPPALSLLFFLLFAVQLGIISAIKQFELPIWLFSSLYVIQFAASLAMLLLLVYMLQHMFLWYPHVRTRTYRFRHLLKSYHSLLKDRAHQILLIFFAWLLVFFLLFSFVLFPLWKLCAKETIRTSRAALAERFEQEVTGKGTLLSAIADTIEGDSLTPFSSLDALKAEMKSIRITESSIDPYRVKDIPSSGFLFLAALVLTLAIPFAISFALFLTAGNYTYFILTQVVKKANLSGIFRPATREERKTAKKPRASKREIPDEDDTLIDVIKAEPDDEPDEESYEFTDDDSIVTSLFTSKRITPDNVSKEETLGKYVDFDYIPEAGSDDSIVFGTPVRSNGSTSKKDSPKKEEKKLESKPNFKKKVEKQVAPKKKKTDDNGKDYTIFDDL